jgi:putative thiamine transport system permease protein
MQTAKMEPAFRLAPAILLAILVLPVAAGVLGTLLPAFGLLPAAGLVEPTLEGFRALTRTPGLFRAVWLSVFTGLGSTLLALALAAMVLAAFLERPAFLVVRRLLSPLLAVPHVAAAFGILALVGPSGFLSRILAKGVTGWEQPPDVLLVNDLAGLALLAGLTLKEAPFLLLMLVASLGPADAGRRLLAARSLGHGHAAAFLLGSWPALYPQIRLAVYAVLAYAASNVEMALVLGPTNPPSLAIVTLRLATDPDIAMQGAAAAAALLQVLVVLACIAAWTAGERVMFRLGVRLAEAGRGVPHAHGLAPLAALGSFLLAALPAAAIGGGIAVLALWSIAGPWPYPEVLPIAFTGGVWSTALPLLAGPALVTVGLAGASSVLAVALVLLALAGWSETGGRPSRRIAAIIYTPLLVPQIAFVFGVSVLLIGTDLDASMLGLAVVHLVFVLPYAYLALAGPWRAFDGRLALAARSLGAGPGKVFLRVRLPILLRPILVATALCFSVSVALYLPTQLVSGGRIETVTTQAISLASGLDRRLIGVLALVQAGLPALAFALANAVPALVHRRRRGLEGRGGA